MQLGLFVVVVFLSSMDLTGGSKVVKGKRQRRSMYETFPFSPSPDAMQTGNANVHANSECLPVQNGSVCPIRPGICAHTWTASWSPVWSRCSPCPRLLPIAVPLLLVAPIQLQPEVHGKCGF